MNTSDQVERYAEWKKLIEEQERSGLSQAEFCRQHELTPSKLTYYRGVIKGRAKNKVKSINSFSPVKVAANEGKSLNEIRVALPNGFQCVFPCQIDVGHIKRVVEVLLSC